MNATFFKKLTLFSLIGFALAGCKVDDPFVDRDVSPLLVDVVGAAWASPFATNPAVTYDSSSNELVLQVRLLELDKTNILDHTKGIDSIPTDNVSIELKYVTNKVVKQGTIGALTFTDETFSGAGSLGSAVSDAAGLVTFRVKYADFGLEGNRIQRAGDKVELRWTGTHKGLGFTRLSQINVSGK